MNSLRPESVPSWRSRERVVACPPPVAYADAFVPPLPTRVIGTLVPEKGHAPDFEVDRTCTMNAQSAEENRMGGQSSN